MLGANTTAAPLMYVVFLDVIQATLPSGSIYRHYLIACHPHKNWRKESVMHLVTSYWSVSCSGLCRTRPYHQIIQFNGTEPPPKFLDHDKDAQNARWAAFGRFCCSCGRCRTTLVSRLRGCFPGPACFPPILVPHIGMTASGAFTW